MCSLVRYRVEHEKIKFISTSEHVIFCLLHKHTNYDVFYDFPKISDHFPKIFKDFPKLFRRLDESFRTFFTFSEDCRRFLKVAEDFRGGTNDVSIKNNTSEHFLRDYVAIAMAILRLVTTTCYFHAWRYQVYARKLTWYFTVVYMINPDMLCKEVIYLSNRRMMFYSVPTPPWDRAFRDLSR